MSSKLINFLTTHKPLSFAAILLLTLVLFGTASLRAEDRRIVTLHVDGHEMVIPTTAPTVAELLERANIKLLEHDLVEPGLDHSIETDSFNVNVYRARPVTVIDGQDRFVVMSPYQSPSRIAESAGLKVYPEDEYKLERIDEIVAEGAVGLKLTIDRSVPITLNMYGQKIDLRTQAESVEQLLTEKGVSLGEKDKVRPGLDKLITSNMSVFVLGTNTDVVTQEEEINFEVEEIIDTSKEIYFSQVNTPGQKGSKSVTYQLYYENGKVVKREKIQEIVTRQPVKEVVTVGSKPVAPTAGPITGSKQDWLAASGIPESQWAYVDSIVTRESGWNPNAVNASSGACGLGQQYPCGKWAGAWNDPVAALQAMNGYVNGRYGGWAQAYAFWQANHSY